MKRFPVVVAVAAAGLVAWMQRREPEPSVVRRPQGEETPRTASQQGRVVYERYGCAMCHGAEGQGGFANPNSETEGKVPPVIYVAEGYTPAELRRKILEGAPVGKADPDGPRPPYRMPGWAGRMTPGDADALIQYLLSLYPRSAEEKWR